MAAAEPLARALRILDGIDDVPEPPADLPPLPPPEAYEGDPDVPAAKLATRDRTKASNYELTDVAELLTDTAPMQYTVAGLIPRGTLTGLVAPPESAKSLLAQNLVACVATGHPFHGRQVHRGLAVYLFGEGHYGARLRFQALDSRYGYGLGGAPLVVSRCAASLLDPVETARVRDAIKAAEDRHGIGLELLVVDTVARFIAPGSDDKAQDMGALLAAVDSLRGDAAGIVCHHPGHADSTRARGSSAWRAAMDCEYTLAAADTPAARIVTVTCAKMKDGDRPAPMSFRIEQAPTRASRPDGSTINSVVLVATDLQAMRPAATGKNQRALLDELESIASKPGEVGIWTEGQLRRIARDLGMSKSSAITAVMGLRSLGYLTATVGGSRLAHVDAKGTEVRN